jgi:TatA/E family protein of Tat protein translocase
MPFSGWEILIVVVIVAILFGYRYLPRLGRSAGEGARELKEGAQEQAGRVKAYVDEHKPDPGEIGRSAGKHVREYRELKDEVMGTGKREEERPGEPSEPAAAKRAEKGDK